MAKASIPIETELKLSFPASLKERLAKSSELVSPRAKQFTSAHIVTTYYDTRDLVLAQRGLSLRVRDQGGKRIQAIKTRGENALAKKRGEWEWPIPSKRPDLHLVHSVPAMKDLPREIDSRLEPMVITDINRTTRVVEVEGAIIEAALDVGSIVAGKVREPVHELELELRHGNAGALYRLALRLHSDTPLAVETASKADRGFILREGGVGHAVNPSLSTLEEGVDGLEGSRLIVESALAHLLANRGPAMAGDVEGVHQARVGIRRVRSALALFAPLLEPHAARLFQDALRRLGQLVGEARDWDVFCDEVLPDSFCAPDHGRLSGLLQEKARSRRRDAHERTARELGAPRFTALCLGIAGWVESRRELPKGSGDKTLRRPLVNMTPDLLHRLWRKAARRGRAVRPGAPPNELHPLRKSLKKLRYGIEFVGAVYPRRRVKRFLRPLKGLQKTLGVINDGAMAMRLAEDLASQDRLELGASLAAIAASRERQRRRAMRKLGKQWKAYERTKPFWI